MQMILIKGNLNSDNSDRNSGHSGRLNSFTLIEILISMAIFIVLLLFVLVNYNHGENSNSFRLQAFDLEDLIYSVQNMALTGQKIDNEIPDNYGINFTLDNNTYTIFGDLNDNEIYDSGTDSIYSSGSLYNNIEFSENEITCESEEDPDSYDIVFIPPQPEMIINNNEDNNECNLSIISNNVDGRWDIFFDAITQRVWINFEE